MRKTIIIIVAIFLPIAVNAQKNKLNHNIEFGFGYAQSEKYQGSTLEARYSLGITKNIDFLVSINKISGLDFSQNSLLKDMYDYTDLRIGVRVGFCFLKICSLKVSCTDGYSVMTYNYSAPDILPNTIVDPYNSLNCTAEYSFMVTPKMNIGAFYGKTWMFSTIKNKNITSMGLCFFFKI